MSIIVIEEDGDTKRWRAFWAESKYGPGVEPASGRNHRSVHGAITEARRMHSGTPVYRLGKVKEPAADDLPLVAALKQSLFNGDRSALAPLADALLEDTSCYVSLAESKAYAWLHNCGKWPTDSWELTRNKHLPWAWWSTSDTVIRPVESSFPYSMFARLIYQPFINGEYMNRYGKYKSLKAALLDAVRVLEPMLRHG